MVIENTSRIMESTTDVLLMQQLSGGDDLALNELMSRWREPVAGFLLRMVGDHATAIDLTQETFVRLYTSRGGYKPTAAFSTFLFHIATNVARSHARWIGRHPTVPLEDSEGRLVHEPVETQLPPDDAAELHEEMIAVNKAIATLPADQREALLLFAVEGMSHAEVAKALGCSSKAVEVRIYRARQTLKKSLGNEES